MCANVDVMNNHLSHSMRYWYTGVLTKSDSDVIFCIKLFKQSISLYTALDLT